MHLYVLPLFVPLALLAARRQPAIELTPRRSLGLGLWVVLLIALRAVAAFLPVDKDSRVLARAIQGSDGSGKTPIGEVVFVDTPPRYGLAFYLGTEVEAVTLAARPGIEPRPAETLGEELRDDEGVRLFVLSRNRSPAFHERSRALGFDVLPQGGWRELAFYRLRRSGPLLDLAATRYATGGPG
jgi:4-amino-4-deoxy-L-arabinose transferase